MPPVIWATLESPPAPDPMDFSAWFQAYLGDIGIRSIRGITAAALAASLSGAAATLLMFPSRWSSGEVAPKNSALLSLTRSSHVALLVSMRWPSRRCLRSDKASIRSATVVSREDR
jgi:hypothetical protein